VNASIVSPRRETVNALTFFGHFAELTRGFPLNQEAVWCSKLEVVYPLKRKNYDELRLTGIHVPRLLVVVQIPESEEEWLRHNEDELALRRCGYWATLLGLPETVNTSRVTVRLPRVNVFDVAGLRSLMGRAARKEPL
jgi:hypothetical protein